MGIYKMLRYFARGVLLAPIAVILLGLIFTYVPGLANFISSVFLGFMGEIELFALAVEVLQNGLSYSSFSWNHYWYGFLGLLLGALSDSVILSVCIFAVKSSCVVFNRKWIGSFTRPEWQLTLIGVVIGVVICGIKGRLAMSAQAILTMVVSIGLYVLGISLMLKGVSLKGHPTYRNRRAGFLINMMLGIVGNMFDAFCGVFVITAVMEGPRLLRAGGNVAAWIAWTGLSMVLLYLNNMVMKLLQPNEV